MKKGKKYRLVFSNRDYTSGMKHKVFESFSEATAFARASSCYHWEIYESDNGFTTFSPAIYSSIDEQADRAHDFADFSEEGW